MSSVPITRSAARSIGASIRRHANARVSGSFSVSADDYKLSGTCCTSNSNARSISNACHRRRRRLPVRPPTFDYTQQHRTNRNTRSFSTAAADDDETINNTGDDGLECLPELSPPMRSRIRTMKSRHDEVLSQLQGGGDQIALGKELSTLTGISNLCDKVSEIHAERESLLELRNESEEDEELMEEIRDELDQLELQLPPLSQKMMKQLVPLLNPDDIDDLTGADAVIDIRAGTGGDEACLFAGDIMAGYEQIAKRGGGDESGNGGKAWDIEILSIGRTDLGGVKEASLSITSRSGGGGGGYSSFESDDNDADQDTAQKLLQQLGPYGFFQYESGVHRVQRVPVNDVRMQTSAVSVAVLPSLADNQISSALPSDELKIDVMRASGAGGQHVNTTESAVRITHIPTGIMAYMQEERSQHKNKSKGLKLVAARVHALRKEQSLKDRSAARGALMGGGDRSERIRTYNFPQDRITDHRCKVSVSGVQSWLGGGGMVRKFGPELYVMEREERVKTMEEEDEEMRRRKNEAAKGGKKGKGKGGKKR